MRLDWCGHASSARTHRSTDPTHSYHEPQSDTQAGEIQSVLDALVGGKAAEPAAAPPASIVVTPVTPVTPQKPASTSGTFNNDLTTPAGVGQALADAFVPKVSDEDAATIDAAIKPGQDQLSASMLQGQQVTSKTLAEVLAVSGAAFCNPKNVDELHAAIENPKCTIIVLSGQVRFCCCWGGDDRTGDRHLSTYLPTYLSI